MSIATTSDFKIAPAPTRPLVTSLVLAAACAALADWLFDGWDVGISLRCFWRRSASPAIACMRPAGPGSS